VLLCYCVAVLLCCCVTVLLCYCVAVLLCCCVTVLLCCCVTVLLCYCVAVLLCCCVTVLLCYCVAVLLFCLRLWKPDVYLTIHRKSSCLGANTLLLQYRDKPVIMFKEILSLYCENHERHWVVSIEFFVLQHVI